MTSAKALRNALLRCRAAVLDLQLAGCYDEAAELAALVRRLAAVIESEAPRAASQGEAGARTASPIAPAPLGLSEAPVAADVPGAGDAPPVAPPRASQPCWCTYANPHAAGTAPVGGTHWSEA